MYLNFKNLFAKLKYRPFHKTLPRSSAFVYWILVRFYETDCTIILNVYLHVHDEVYEGEQEGEEPKHRERIVAPLAGCAMI